jgi:hypothetical protein
MSMNKKLDVWCLKARPKNLNLHILVGFCSG